ncbi:hypothetical protein IMG5_121500 [Ichthyophthirius multifiliis]|uniref:Glycogen debranching enzyme glucanotransferase domain-containing protein n=1 Tax=Ichthyophthirius multifiliis TaxID=5932 RepID=G0QV63_ICHMU|nr:hypothetical protein IMG5_121500 [Ichthyophthirius multifiliis]EGR30904.1 hypothetical protein IMG5_121500 [Ichthyophthirius multifiliis]|eukprot:XP_004032491.1 hypothetical protein IMG5_121500 [Ichthyophthirius multifiliis]
MDELVIQTVLPYSLGDVENWVEVLKNQTLLGYNGFHFPPIQQLGASGSYYSINEQLQVNIEIFKQYANMEDGGFQKMKEIVNTMEKEHNAICIVDILLNHTSFDSEWLLQVENGVYNVENTPSLQSALDLDLAIKAFSENLAAGNEKEYYNGSNRVENEEMVDCLMNIMKKKYSMP